MALTAVTKCFKAVEDFAIASTLILPIDFEYVLSALPKLLSLEVKSEDVILFKRPTEVAPMLIDPITVINAFIALDEFTIASLFIPVIDVEYFETAFPIMVNSSTK